MVVITSRLFAVVCSLLLGCSTAMLNFTDNQNTARVGKEFSLKLGQQLKLDGEDLKVKFTGVPQDSRCPTNVNCVWAGNAEVALEWTHDKCTTPITLNTHSSAAASDEAKVGAFRVKLIKLEPYPHSEKKISPGDYTATLRVIKE
jgi:hypothetical protein